MREEVPLEIKPMLVSETTTQVGETATLWSWVEPSVWTERMLTALERGVKGGKWFSLIDKVFSAENLASAFSKVAKNEGAAGVDHVSVRDFERNLEANLARLYESLRSGTYRPQAVRRVWIPKLGSAEKRPLGIPRWTRIEGLQLRILSPIQNRRAAQDGKLGFVGEGGNGVGCHDFTRIVALAVQHFQIEIEDGEFDAG